MIYALFKTYFWLLFGISFAAVTIFAFGIYLIFRLEKKPLKQANTPTLNVNLTHECAPLIVEHDFSHADVSAIAGDDVLNTQLDLAQALVHTGKLHDAEKILKQVAATGSEAQKQEANQLLLQVNQEKKTSIDIQHSSAKWTSPETESSRHIRPE